VVYNHYLECIGQRLEGLGGDVRFATLNLADMRAVKARPVRQNILRPTVLQTQPPYVCPELAVEGSHLGQSLSTLRKTILVIPSNALVCRL